MKYTVQYQYRRRESSRPDDYGQEFEISTEDGQVLIPNIGDHVSFHDEQGIKGVVENRTFFYFSNNLCSINIVVTDSDVDSGRLAKA